MYKCVVYFKGRQWWTKVDVELPAIPLPGEIIDGRWRVVERTFWSDGRPTVLHCEAHQAEASAQ